MNFFDKTKQQTERLQSQIFSIVSDFLAKSIVDGDNQTVIDFAISNNTLPERSRSCLVLHSFDIDLAHCHQWFHCPFTYFDIFVTHQCDYIDQDVLTALIYDIMWASSMFDVFYSPKRRDEATIKRLLWFFEVELEMMKFITSEFRKASLPTHSADIW